jgi:hypothetical protein
MKKVVFILVLFLPFLVSGQQKNESPIKRNTIYFEAFGQGLYNSFVFDRLYRVDKKIKTSINTGITIIPHPELFVLGTPISYNYIFGKTNHHLELGIGFTFMHIRFGNIRSSRGYDVNGIKFEESFIGYENNIYTYFTPKIGYRFQKPQGGFFFRITATPPVAGINRIGGIKGGKYDNYYKPEIQFFKSAAFYEPFRIWPWAGISFGYTLKK